LTKDGNGVTVAVLASPEDGSDLERILATLSEAGVEAYGLKIHARWEAIAPAKLMARFDKASHFLVLASAASVVSSWFSFALGFGYSRGTNFALYRFDASYPFPRYLSGLPVFDGLEELAAYYRVERAEWLVQEERRASRAVLLEMGVSVHNDSLAQCAREGDTKAVELFMKAGYPPDSRDKYGVPLLCLAARGKHRAVVEILLARGAQIDLQSEDRGYSPLMDAAQAGSADLVALFLERGASPDLTSKDGQTALIVAVGRNDAEVVRLLVSGGADPDLCDKLGLSARKYAALFKNPAILSLFGPSR
jgi:hypothetical protein